MLRALLSSWVCFLFLLSVTPVPGWAKDAKGLENAGATPFDLGMVDATAFLPKPPDAGSLLFLYDRHCYEQGKALRQDAKIARQAAEGADPHALPEFFSEAFGTAISAERLPTLYTLIQRMRKTFGDSVGMLKNVYGRERPFALYGDATCFHQAEARQRTQGSYPSGHSTHGWGVALLLSEINPERAGAILKRGMEYGQNRVICGYHWQTDVDAGRLLASALFARLHANAEFQAELEKAKAEYALLRNRSEGMQAKQ